MTIAPARMMSARSALRPRIRRRPWEERASRRSRIAVTSDWSSTSPWRCLRSPGVARRWVAAGERADGAPEPHQDLAAVGRRQRLLKPGADLHAQRAQLQWGRGIAPQELPGGPHRAERQARGRDDPASTHPAELEARPPAGDDDAPGE